MRAPFAIQQHCGAHRADNLPRPRFLWENLSSLPPKGPQEPPGPAGEVTAQQLSDGLASTLASANAGSSANSNRVWTLDAPFADPDAETLRVKVNELLWAMRRADIGLPSGPLPPKPGSKLLYAAAMGDWRVKGSDESSSHDLNDDLGDDHRGFGEVELENSLTRTGAAPSGAKAKVELSGIKTSMELEIEVQDAPLGAYAVSVGGVVRGTLTVVAAGSGTRGKLKFESSPDQAGELPLTFPASGQAVQISRSGVVYFTGTSPTMP